MKPARFIALVLVAALNASSGVLAQTAARFEVTSIKAIRPTLLNTIAALQKRDVAAARDAFEAYDSGWNGIEVYINFRYPEMYKELEGGYQARIAKGLSAANVDTAGLLAEAKAMLAKFDEEVAQIEKAPPIGRLFDDVARLRIERAHLREVTPAIKAGKPAKARTSFQAFNDNWDSIEDLVRERSRDAYVAIESGMIEIEKALMPAQPDADKLIGLVSDVMNRYNAIVSEITKEARSAK